VSTKLLGDIGLERVAMGEHVQVKLRTKFNSKRCTGLRGNIIGGRADPVGKKGMKG